MAAQSRMYRELEHQLRNPVFQARKRVGFLLGLDPEDLGNAGLYDLKALNGLIAKTHRILSNMRIFEHLALNQEITIRTTGVSIATVQRLINQACSDHRTLWQSKSLEFGYEAKIFDAIRIKEIRLEQSLFEQVLNNVLDNSAKYCAPRTAVTFDAYLEADNPAKRSLVLVVKNLAGVRLNQQDVDRLGERGYRSQQAARLTTEGSGLGLYLVKKIMEAHRGKMRPVPTDSLGVTRIELAFPLED